MKEIESIPEFISRLIATGSPIKQLFILNAIEQLSDLVAKSKPIDYEIDPGSYGQTLKLRVDPEAWIKIGHEIQREVKMFLTKKDK